MDRCIKEGYCAFFKALYLFPGALEVVVHDYMLTVKRKKNPHFLTQVFKKNLALISVFVLAAVPLRFCSS